MKIIRLTQIGVLLVAAWGLDAHRRQESQESPLPTPSDGPLVAASVTDEVPHLGGPWLGRIALEIEALPEARVEVPAEPALEAVVLATPPVEAVAAADIVPPDMRPGGPSRVLLGPELESWERGFELFDRSWEESEGLGAPGFNAPSCTECHRDPAPGGSGNNDFNVIRMRGHSGYEQPELRGNNLTRMQDLREQMSESRRAVMLQEIQTPTLLGLGAIDTIADEEIELRADPEDLDGDGIRGVVSWVQVSIERHEVGRFGWKAQMPRLADFACLALGGELGLTAPDQGRGFGLHADEDGAQDPEVSQPEFEHLVFFLETLAAPRRKGSFAYQVQLGEELFERVGCAACHVPVLNGTDGPVPLYSDLLLHDVSVPGDRSQKRRSSSAEPAGLRTPPLWGIGETAPYLHDGRAATLREAILAHDGEAVGARQRFVQLIEPDQEAVLRFLEDL